MKNYLQAIFFATLLATLTESSAQNITLVKDINTTSVRNSNPVKMAVYRDTLYFVAQPDDKGGSRLFKSDGTAEGTKLIGPSVGIDAVRDFFFYKNAFYFIWNDQIHGQELWVSDGSPAGTHVFLDITPGAGSSEIAYLTICNNKLFFQATDGVDFNRLWVSDGTVAGTQKLGVIARAFNGMNEFIVFKDKVYFSGGNATVPYGLFVSDGTSAGTGLVKEGHFGSSGGNFAVLNNKMYFDAADDQHGSELWVSDGTGPNTQMLFNIATNDNLSFQSNGGPNNFFEHAGTIYFAASDGTHGSELWATDGTAANTRMVADLLPDDFGVAPTNFTLYNNEVYFFGTVGGAKVLYKTDGTQAGTQLIKTFPASDLYEIYEYKALLYMALGAGISSYVWVSDGTGPGTVQIDPIIYTLQTQEMNFVNYKEELYLPAYTSATGMELFKMSAFPTGLEENAVPSIGLLAYPNPSNGSFTLSGRKDITELQAYDAQGNAIGLDYHEQLCHLHTTAKGIYLLRITSRSHQTEVLKVEIK